MALITLATAGVSNATILIFDFDPPLFKLDIIPTAYGDNVSATSDAVGSYLEGNGFTPNITVDYRTLNASTGETLSNSLSFWTTDYGDLVNVAYPTDDDFLGEISLIPEVGFNVTLNSFDLGGWLQTDQPGQTVRILDANYNILLNYSPFDVEGNSGHSSFAPNITSSGILRIQFGPSYSTGIDNINFDQRSDIPTVPEPTSLLGLLGLGALGGCSLLKRRKQ